MGGMIAGPGTNVLRLHVCTFAGTLNRCIDDCEKKGHGGQSFAHCRRLKKREWQEGRLRSTPHKNVSRAWIQQLQALDGVGSAHAPAPIKARLRDETAARGGGSRKGLGLLFAHHKKRVGISNFRNASHDRIMRSQIWRKPTPRCC